MVTEIKIFGIEGEVESAKDVLNKSLEAPKLDPIKLGIANQFIEGTSIAELAEFYDVPADIITETLEKKEVKNYIDTIFLSQGYLNRFKRLNLIDDVINQKVEEAVDSGFYSKKDLFDWLKLLNEMETSTKPKAAQGPQVAVQINQNYENLVRDLFEDDKKT